MAALINAFLMVMIMAVITAPALATDHIVGDEAGWKLNVDYTTWAQGKQFHVGDRLIFKYTQGSHNVFRLNTTDDFRQCVAPNLAGLLTSGNDIITLATPGNKWYICGVSGHCGKGMKLAITVISSSSDLAPAPAPMTGSFDPNAPGTSAATGYSGSISFAWVLAGLTMYQMIMA